MTKNALQTGRCILQDIQVDRGKFNVGVVDRRCSPQVSSAGAGADISQRVGAESIPNELDAFELPFPVEGFRNS